MFILKSQSIPRKSMEVNPTESDQTRWNPEKTIRHARFRRSPGGGGSLICSSGISTATLMSSSQVLRSDLLGVVCLNCPLDNRGSCSSCSAISAASLDQSAVTMTGGPSTRATETLEKDEGSVYNGRTVGLTGRFRWKPSTTTAMSMPGAEESTVYNGKIGLSLFGGLESGTDRTASATPSSSGVRNENESIFDGSIGRGGGLVSFGILPSSALPPVNTMGAGAATRVGGAIIHKSPNPPKRSWHGDTAILFHETGTSSRLSNSVLHKRRRTESMSIRVRAVNSEELGLPPDGYKWWKYGRKDIKGSPYPRNYYRCKTLDDCDAKKHVMRVVDEPSMLDITYKGKHSHAPPLELNATMHATAAASILPSASASAAADIVPGVILAAPQEQPTTAKSADFIEYL